MSTLRDAAAGGAVLCAALICACDRSALPAAPETVEFRTLQLVSGDRQVGEARSVLSVPLAVRVGDHLNRPVAGVRIEWQALAGGSVDSTSSVTDVAGLASVTRQLGNSAGPYGTTATIANDTSQRVTFYATSLVQGAMHITYKTGDHGNLQRDTVLTKLTRYRVMLLDHTDKPVRGVRVHWQLYGLGTLTNDTSTTDDNGIAQTTHTLGTTAQTERVLAIVDGLVGSPVTFTADVTPGAPMRTLPLSGNNQIGYINGSLGVPYRITVRDSYGNTISVAKTAGVDWSVTLGAGSVQPEPDGYAVHRLGPVDGLQTVAAQLKDAPHIPPVVFTSRAVTDIVGVSLGYYCYDPPAFVPNNVTVPSGKTVAWIWQDICQVGPHSITFEDDETPPVSSILLAAATHVRTFTGPPRVIRYRCRKHSTGFTDGMSGTVTIR